MTRTIVLTMMVFLVSLSCNEPKNESNSIRPDNSETDPDWFGLRFKSALKIEETGVRKNIDLEELPVQGCSYYPASGLNIFYWAFGQGEGVKTTSNIEIIMNLDGPPKPGQSWKIDGKSPKEIVVYHRFSRSTHQVWGLSDPEAFCTVKIGSFNIIETKTYTHPDTKAVGEIQEFLSKGELNCLLVNSNKDSRLSFEADMACTGTALIGDLEVNSEELTLQDTNNNSDWTYRGFNTFSEAKKRCEDNNQVIPTEEQAKASHLWLFQSELKTRLIPSVFYTPNFWITPGIGNNRIWVLEESGRVEAGGPEEGVLCIQKN
ncbi:MAG: hypothetical protein AB8G05_04630 [Oligoflexales bacterium]